MAYSSTTSNTEHEHRFSKPSKVSFGAEVLHYGEVATAHGRALQDKRKKV